MENAQENLLLTLDLRADAVAKIASRIVAVRGDQEGAAEQALDQIAGEMQAFLASDVVYLQRVVPVHQPRRSRTPTSAGSASSAPGSWTTSRG